MANLIEMSNISKSFGGSLALDRVSLELLPGSVHALMGENGAGKSTLMKILAGVHQPDSGEIFKNGHKIAFLNPKEALDFGISTVFQEMTLLANLTIAENMFLGREPVTRFGTVDYKRMNAETGKALKELSLDLDPRTLVSNLTIAERQFVEIAHGIKADASIFILDEPTAALNAADVEILNKHIRRLRDAGKALVYISHRMDEIFQICDTVTVLKDGKLIGTRPLSEMTPTSLIAMMVGRELKDLFPARNGSASGEPMLDIKHFKIGASTKPFSLHVCKGEIVALAGLEGQGQQKLLRSLVGKFQPFSGTITLNGKSLALPVPNENGVRKLQQMGVGFIPEDRKEEGLFLNLPIAHNIEIALHSARAGFSPAKNYRTLVADTIKRLNVRTINASAPVGALSGGNQQKVLLGRYIAANLDILLIEEPTRGVDIGAKSEIYKLLRDFTQNGGAVLVLSRETVELIGLCDRIYVVHGDTVVADMPAAKATEHDILDAALSA
ncbi:sugar ABC transporter ATP-binding protein [Agrobacterium tumefaciens]|uniref:Riorf75 protein n=2 Tax=Rhizobium/Agrobacterium group TaxID=227290 RepID=Q9KWA9_RHIRH|nr:MULTISPECIES: sugar ABC transporter ATP-binding protein [Rhizobium/Agrobacterium group]ASK42956.1 ABC transporter ATP-binding protein [Rhizobium rhizogenes]MCZ7977361.1 sugar ABC transporter ATP-binding protein [Agrobacterium salinitolerans]MDA5243170.1 sugar ABC transporter ATP-binding protein [Agrobacterium sp. MAFF310724]MDA5247648.1 sugar ABC transporter ATP-binding protein [Agrobacterium sp. MAFF210268]TRB03317.1 sugar ABC transporter ATP-binding protein [Agrobacterium tumefaciens]